LKYYLPCKISLSLLITKYSSAAAAAPHPHPLHKPTPSSKIVQLIFIIYFLAPRKQRLSNFILLVKNQKL